MLSHIKTINAALNPLRRFSDDCLSPALDLGIRLYMANIFFASGWLKYKNFLNDDWASTVYLFTDIHPIPGVPGELSAIMGTAGELILPVLLALGLCGRFGAAGLIVMTAIIQFIVPADYGLANPVHYLWILLLAVIVFKGPGRFSLDALLRRFAGS